jgi:ATP-dependent DNA helicase RecG
MSIYESENIELKEVYTPELKKEVVAFANTNGGTIYIGIQDNGEITGMFTNADEKLRYINRG